MEPNLEQIFEIKNDAKGASFQIEDPNRDKKYNRSVFTVLGLTIPIALSILSFYLLSIGGLYSLIIVIPLAVCASLLSIVFSAISFKRHEKAALANCITLIPAILFLLWLSLSFSKHLVSENKRNRVAQIETQIIEDAEYRRQLVHQKEISILEAKAISSGAVINSFNSDEILFLWEREESHLKNRMKYVIRSTNTPPIILRNIYQSALHREKQGWTSPHPLVYEKELLTHPNLPPDIIEEIDQIDEPRLVELWKVARIRHNQPKTKTPNQSSEVVRQR